MKINTSKFKKDKEIEGYFLFQNESFPEEVIEFKKYSKDEGFEGKEGQTFIINDGKRRLIICGLGNKKEFEKTNDLDVLRKMVALSLQFANKKEGKILSITPPNTKNLELSMEVIGEAITLSNYKFNKYKSKLNKSKKSDDKDKENTVEEINIVGEKSKILEEALNRGIIKAEAQNYARELDETPPNIATPLYLAGKAKELAKENNLSVTILGKKELKRKKMGGILAVNQGSAQPPVMVVLEYNKRKKNLPLYAVVGKGVTFDSGGISLKPSSGMEEMKYDKTGAINAFGVIKAVSKLKLPIRLMIVTPFVENMPGANAQRPSDIITGYNGKTIEVLNTDAEGRLILADALAYASEKKPKGIIDMATLTGAVVVCLGRHAIGMLGNDDKMAKEIEEAGRITHERVWRLPLWKEYSKMVEGEFADIRNIGSERGHAGTITAAAFLKEFVGDSKWIHLDIAAVDHNKGHAYLGSGASGTGVRLVVESLRRLSKK